MVNAEVLPLIIFSLVFGGVLTTLGERAQIIIRFFEGVNEAIMGMVHILIGGQLRVNPLVS
jgi:solute carrier family 1 (high affinity glutamate transporter) protein 1